MSLVANAIIEAANISTITLCGVMKLPLLYNLIISKSSFGISLISVLLEFSGYCIMMSYNIYSGYSLSSYLEYPLLVVQDLVILIILLKYIKFLNTPAILFSSATLLTLVFGISLGYIPKAIILILVNCCPLFSASSKIAQLQTIISCRDSSGTSIISWIISAYTSIARLLTVYIETNDISLMINFTVALVLNLCIITACVIYAPKKNVFSAKKKA